MINLRMRPDIAIAVLAGVDGSRIGGGKPLIRLGDTTLVEQAVIRAGSWSNLVVVSIRSIDQLGALQLPWIIDAPSIGGPLAGLAAALVWARDEGSSRVMTLPCDMPFLPDDLPERLLVAIGDLGAAVASSGGNLHPVCGLWRVEAADQIAAYCSSGRRSLKGFAAQLGFAEVEWPTVPRDPFFNVNSPADLVIAEAMLA